MANEGNASDLNDKQERFCREYVIDLNGTQAAIKAGYAEKNADVKASQLLRIVKVQALIKKLQAEISKRTEITADMVIQEIAKIAFANQQDYVSEGNSIVDVSKIDKDKAAAVESIQTTTTTTKDGFETTQVKIKQHSKVAALEQLAKHLGLYEKDNKQKGSLIRVSVKKKDG